MSPILWKCHLLAGSKPLTCKLPHPESRKTAEKKGLSQVRLMNDVLRKVTP